MNWPVWGFDAGRSGVNPYEQTLSVQNVRKLRMQWQTLLGAAPVDSSPILIAGAGPSGDAMLFATSKNGTTFGIDAVTGSIIWRFTSKGGPQNTSAPAADPSGTAIYAAGSDGFVHKLTAATGVEIYGNGFPVQATLMPKTELLDAPLNVANGYLYVTLGGLGSDKPPYDGHVVSVNLATGATSIFNSLCSEYRQLLGPSGCSQQRSGIWARGGAVIDPDPSMNGAVYVATGNGDFDANTGGYDYGDSVIGLAPDLSAVLSSYTPSNYAKLDATNYDLGSTSPGLIPKQSNSSTPFMLVQGGKDALLRLVNRSPLPGVGNELQVIKLPKPLYSTPAVWSDSYGNVSVYIGVQNRLNAYHVLTNASGQSRLHQAWSVKLGHTLRGTSPVVANGIVFIAFDNQLFAVNAASGQTLWSSRSNNGGTIGVVHWQSPIVVNGWVYCADQSRNITAFALKASPSSR